MFVGGVYWCVTMLRRLAGVHVSATAADDAGAAQEVARDAYALGRGGPGEAAERGLSRDGTPNQLGREPDEMAEALLDETP